MIRTIAKGAAVALVAGGLNLASVAPAGATPTIQRRCSFTSITDPTVENGQTQAGEVNGGPITDDSQAGATITITCTIQVGGANATHAGADSVSCAGSAPAWPRSPARPATSGPKASRSICAPR